MAKAESERLLETAGIGPHSSSPQPQPMGSQLTNTVCLYVARYAVHRRNVPRPTSYVLENRAPSFRTCSCCHWSDSSTRYRRQHSCCFVTVKRSLRVFSWSSGILASTVMGNSGTVSASKRSRIHLPLRTGSLSKFKE